MAGQLIPPPEMAPRSEKATSPTERILVWCDLMNACEQFLLAGLQRKVGPDGDLRSAYRDWYRRQCEEKDQRIQALHRKLHPSGETDAV